MTQPATTPAPALAAFDWDEPVPKGYRRNHNGDLVREANVSATDQDMDSVVQTIFGFGRALSAQMFRFRSHTLNDISAFVDRVVSGYGGKFKGRKGNLSLTSFDGRKRVQIAVAEQISIGPEVEAAQAIVEACIDDWSKRGNLKLRALVDQAFKPDAAGRLSVSQLLRLRRVQIDDARWRQVQDAISDALRPIGKSEYVRLYQRSTPEQPWQQLPLNLATVRRQEDSATPAEQLKLRLCSALAEARHLGLAETAIKEALQVAVQTS